MKVQGALIQEQGVEFAVIVVKQQVIQNSIQGNDMISTWQNCFGVPVVLMAQDGRGVPKYFGRTDIVKFLCGVSLNAIPWREYTLN